MALNAQSVGALAWLALGLFFVWTGHDLGLGTVTEPGSGFLVFWGGILISGFALSIGLESRRGPGVSLAGLWAGTRWGKVLAVVAALVAYGVLLGPLGFVLATLPLVLALLRLVDPVPWRLAVPIALVATLGVWWVLERYLSIRLPPGLLEFG